MCVRCGTGTVAWCASPDDHASDAGWDAGREARFCQLIDASLTGFMGPGESRELSALKAARDKATAQERDSSATLAWLRTLRRGQLRKLVSGLAGYGPYIMRALTAARELSERDEGRAADKRGAPGEGRAHPALRLGLRPARHSLHAPVPVLDERRHAADRERGSHVPGQREEPGRPRRGSTSLGKAARGERQVSAANLIVAITNIVAWPAVVIVAAILLSPGSIRRGIARQERKQARSQARRWP